MRSSTSPVMHFVKESCLRRMGVRPDAQMSSRRPNWLLATTTRLEFCQIRKADNRSHSFSSLSYCLLFLEMKCQHI